MTITVPKSGYIDIKIFEKVLDISRIKWYSLEEKDGNLVLMFYDKNRKVIKHYAKAKTKKNASKCNKES